MGVRYFNQSRISPTIRSRADWWPKAKASSSSASAKQVTQYRLSMVKCEYAKQDKPFCMKGIQGIQEIQGWA
ncbi:hypothetical protein [uncultured Shewanella sp.]|uniref:hypothetical protein n=1 Tax=uncultured Shewanella sp. TaxID=173975 RepID=UPI002601B39F|nr:hypothetical protein [uncultured Shewanella sp.]